ncbi:Uncharacterised protein [Vibrio cholerae]|nr:Uncharacterised protein [Vibrio cholerae]
MSPIGLSTAALMLWWPISIPVTNDLPMRLSSSKEVQLDRPIFSINRQMIFCELRF